jgi:excisionase family DNA binding protein
MKQLFAIGNEAALSDVLTAAEAAEYLRISEWTLRHWVSDKKIRFIKIGRAVRFKKTHLDRFLQDNVHGKEVKPDS